MNRLTAGKIGVIVCFMALFAAFAAVLRPAGHNAAPPPAPAEWSATDVYIFKHIVPGQRETSYAIRGTICNAPVTKELTSLKLRRYPIVRIPYDLMSQVKKWSVEPGYDFPTRDLGKPFVVRTTLQLEKAQERRGATFLARDLSDFLKQLDSLTTPADDATAEELSWMVNPVVLELLGVPK